MPNWCFTKLVIKNDNKQELTDFEKSINKWVSIDSKKNDFDKWLGNIVDNSGIGDSDVIPCRGNIDEIYMDDDDLVISTSTAWEPMLKMWKLLLDKYLPNASLTYYAEETGCGLFATNDHDCAGQYLLDIYACPKGKYNDTYETYSKEDVVKILQDIFYTKENDIESLIELAYDSDGISVNEWEYADIDEF